MSGKPKVGDTLHRRELVKKMFLDESIDSPVKIMGLLKERHGIVVSRSTVNMDIKKLADVVEVDDADFESVVNNFYDDCFLELKELSDGASSIKDKLNIIKTQSQLFKDRCNVLNDIRMRKTGRWRDVDDGDEEVDTVVF